MEDTHVMLDDINHAFGLPNDSTRAFYAVYDGHGGKNAADIAADKVHTSIIKDDHFLTNVEEAIKIGFAATDKRILEFARREEWSNGTTAVSSFLIGNTLYIGNVGDSEAVLAKQNGDTLESVLLTEKHKPTATTERARIEAAGGKVIFGRVLGSLAVSKAFGDIDFKFPNNKGSGDFVSAEPYVNKVELTPSNPFLIIACDGLWDKLTYDEAIQFIAKMRSEGKDPTETAQAIVKHSLDLGTMDNVTVIVVYLDWSNVEKKVDGSSN